ncbi:MAG: large-conductance mechanosensitive channel protein MscL [Alistipes sp.]|nr:large-conductance mechanosensitive channel protein MscL [Alistipes sp.]
MGFLKEFKEFAVKGNVMDMAVGVIIGGAFGKIVTSVVNDIIMPPVGLLIGGVDFTDMKLTLKQAVLDAAGAVVTPAVTWNYGAFVQQVVDFTILAFCVFLMVKLMNRLTKKPAPAPAPAPAPEPPKPSNEEVLLAEIRDLLKEKK